MYREEIGDALALVEHVNGYGADCNHVRPHEAIAWNRPADLHAIQARPDIPNFEIEKILPTTRRGSGHRITDIAGRSDPMWLRGRDGNITFLNAEMRAHGRDHPRCSS